MHKHRLFLLAAVLGLAACSPHVPSQVNTGPMRVEKDMMTKTFSAERVDVAQVSAAAQEILSGNGTDPALTIPYMVGQEVTALQMETAYKTAFAAEGISGLSVSLVPVMSAQDADEAVLAWQVLKASAAPGCPRLPGYQGGDDLAEGQRYRFGCEMQASLSRMVADPSDLLGKTTADGGYSRRNGIIIDSYQGGTPQEPMQGFSASGIGGQ
jgi:type IV pilus biogenesis protein CpaD/CtpE